MDFSSEQIFHCTHDSAYKFWTVCLVESVQTVRFGRIGTAGQTHQKSFESAEAARLATEQLIAQKQAKGYTAVSRDEHYRASPKPPTVSDSPQLLLAFEENTKEAEAKPAPALTPLLFDF